MASTDVPEYFDWAMQVLDKWIAYKQFFLHIPGVAVGIVYKDKVVFSKAYGEVKIDSLFRIASISKTFTSTAIMQLVEQEKLNLDDKVSKYVSWFESKKDKNLESITIRQLLSHTAGIERDGNTAHWYDDKFPSLGELQKHIQEGGLTVFGPIERFKYSNFGFAVLGEVIHQISGQEYRDYVQKNILDKLKMDSTYPDLTPKAEIRLAKGYGRLIPDKKREVFPNPDTKALSAATGFISNVSDLCKYLIFQMSDNNKLLSSISKKEMHRVQWFRGDEEENYGLGFEIWKSERRMIVGHGGGFQGFITTVGMDLKEEIGIVVLTNTINGWAAYLRNGVFHTLKYFRDNKQDFSRKGKENFKKYEGLFTGRWGDTQILDINGHLLGVALREDRVMKDVDKLEHLQKDEFKITEGDEFGVIGERVKFIFKGKRVIGVNYGASSPHKKVERLTEIQSI